MTFDRPIKGFNLGNADFELLHVADDGSTSPLLPGEARITEGLDPDDASGSTVSLSLSKPLTQGDYELLLSPNNIIQGVDGSSLASISSPQLISEFSFSPAQTGRSTAIDLQTLGPIETIVSGNLNLAANPGAVQYYKFQVAPGHHWLVGLEISAHDEGGTLDSAISLFNAQGELIQSANEGLPSDPGDPYLFQGLDPGTYYVGISAVRNVPDASGAYNPGQSEIEQDSAGGPFRLHLIADPADQTTQVLGLRVDHADPGSAAPTGLTLQFSGAIDLSTLEYTHSPALILVDQQGNTWPVTPIGYNASLGQLSLAFNQPLAPGSYTLELAGSNSLVDLAGKVPTAQGFSTGELGSFTVGPSTRVPGDLGPILPGLAVSGIGSTVQVQASAATTETFEVVEPGIYDIGGVPPSSGVQFAIEDFTGQVLMTGPGNNQTGDVDLVLSSGVYRIVLTTSQASTSVTLTVRQKQNQLDSLLESGVSQGPALNLRLVNPQANFGSTTESQTTLTIQGPPAPPPSTSQSFSQSSSAPSGSSTSQGVTGPASPPPTAVTPAPSPSPVVSSSGRPLLGEGTVAIGLATPIGPAPTVYVYNGGLMGRPSSSSAQISVVGTSSASGLAAIASNDDNLPGGLMKAPVPIEGDERVDVVAPVPGPEVIREAPGSGQSGVTMESGLLARAPGSRLEDDRTLANADWIGRLIAGAFDWFDGSAVDSNATPRGATPEGFKAVPDSGPLPLDENRVESASVTSPLGIGIILGTIAYRYRRKMLRKVSGSVKAGSKSPIRPVLAGPHQRPRVGVGIR